MIRGVGCLFVTVLAASCDPGAASTGGGADLGGPGRYGLIRLATTAESVSGVTRSQSLAGAAFVDTSPAGAGCKRREDGPCALYHCPGGAGRAPNAGTIVLAAGEGAVSLAAHEDGSYRPFSQTDGALFMGGQKVMVGAAGGPVPAFSAVLSFPRETFTLSSPLISPALTTTFERRADLTLSFVSSTAGVRLSISQDAGTDHGTYIECAFTSPGGKGTVPAGLLSGLLPTQGADHTAALLIGPAVTQALSAGDYLIDITAIGTGAAAQAIVR